MRVLLEYNKMIGQEKPSFVIGREEEMQELLNLLDKAREGSSKTVFIAGEPGTGKTSLIDEVIAKASEDGFLVLDGTCRYADNTPYRPFEDAWRSSGETSLKELFFTEKDDDLEDKKMLDAFRNVAFYETAQRMKKISHKRPLFISLDDMHWADQGTLNLFHYLSDRLKDSPVFLVGSYAPGDAGRGTGFSGMKQQMSRKKLYDEVELEPLDIEGTERMIRILMDKDEVPEGFVEKVYEKTEGIPLLIKEGLHHIQEQKHGSQDDAYSEDIFELPMLMDNIVNIRVHRLGMEARKLLQLGSVYGVRVPYRLLEELTDDDELEILDAVDELIENRLWEEDKDGNHFYFSHNIFRDIVYQGIGKWLEKKRLHSRVAEGISRVFREDIEQNYQILAYHLREAERYDESVENYVKAGKRAEELYSHEDAVEMYKEALSIFDISSDISADKVGILENIAEAYRLMGMYQKCRDHLNLGLNDVSDFDEKQRLYRKIAESLREQGEYEKALEIAEGRSSIREKDTLETCRLQGIKGWCLMYVGKYEEAVESFELGRKIAEELENDKEIAQAFHNLGSISLRLGDYEAALDNLNTAKEIREKIDDVQLSKTLNNIAGLNSLTGNLDKALEQYDECLSLYRERGNKPVEGKLLNNVGVIHYKKGELEKAVDVLNKGLDISRQVEGRSSEANFLVNLGQVYVDMEELERAEEFLDKGLELSEELEYLNGILLVKSILIQLKLEKGETDRAEGYADEVLKLSSKLGVKREEGIGKYLKGNVLRDKEEWDEAVSMYEEALEVFEKLGTLDLKGEVLYEYGILRERVGDVGDAVELVEGALDIFEDWGMELWADRCREKLDEIRV